MQGRGGGRGKKETEIGAWMEGRKYACFKGKAKKMKEKKMGQTLELSCSSPLW